MPAAEGESVFRLPKGAQLPILPAELAKQAHIAHTCLSFIDRPELASLVRSVCPVLRFKSAAGSKSDRCERALCLGILEH